MGEPVQDAQVLSLRLLTPTVRELVLQPSARRLSFEPGQWVSLRLPVGPRPPLVRAYSMAEPESEDGRLVLAFDLVPGGLGSGYLAGLTEGDRVALAGPFGKFLRPDPSHAPLLFAARYTGIVPVRCMVRAIATRPNAGRVTLVYCIPSADEARYDEEFRALARRHPWFRYEPLVEADAPGEAPHLRAARTLGTLLDEAPRPVALVSGVRSFVKSLRALLTERGLERGQVRHETYD